MDYTVTTREMACLDMDTRTLRPGCPVGGMPCPVASCSTGHLNFRQLVRHWKRYHELEIHAHKCPLCGITDTRRNDLKRHIRVMHWVTGGNMEHLMKSVVAVTVVNPQYKEPGTAVLPRYVRPSQDSTEDSLVEDRITGVTPADDEEVVEVVEEIVEVDEVYYEALTPREMAQQQREEYVRQHAIHLNELETPDDLVARDQVATFADVDGKTRMVVKPNWNFKM
ncbi:Hypothetical predicted protein [Mytilus galloprovincialis]|uniref:C2H2-type domain-containing protein n=1 Tax=Mytilus galloprovincialis TaxID=29158 RepID=A0A8B6EPF4_MYTGA|nr:Hypothetical predicted protein [Mytilus galloprovincialis]